MASDTHASSAFSSSFANYPLCNISTLSSEQQQLVQHAVEKLNEIYGNNNNCVHVGLAPGRVNLIGEHTDYNEGFVMPLAIDKYTVVVGRANNGNTYRLYSSSVTPSSILELSSADFFRNPRTVAVADTCAPTQWHDYFRGVVALVQQQLGKAVHGFDVYITSTVPLGGGLSSSASLEIAAACFVQSLLQLPLDPVVKARLAQQCEHEYCGVRCGIMDQFIVTLAEKEHVMLLDCKTQTPQLVNFTDPNIAILITNSNVKHNLAGSEYEQRRLNCEEAVKILQMQYKHIKSLRDVNLPQLMSMESLLPETVFYRARHVITENDRTHQAAVCLATGDYARLGQLMTFSHVSLKNDYEVSCEELDELVDIALELKGVYGSRMTGGGFGGCTVTLVASSEVANVVDVIQRRYTETTGKHATCIITRPQAGACIVQL